MSIEPHEGETWTKDVVTPESKEWMVKKSLTFTELKDVAELEKQEFHRHHDSHHNDKAAKARGRVRAATNRRSV